MVEYHQSLCLTLRAVATVLLDHDLLVFDEAQDVGPLLDEWRDLLAGLQFPAVIWWFIRRLEFPHCRVCDHRDIYSFGNEFVETHQKILVESFCDGCVSFAVTTTVLLDAVDIAFLQKLSDQERFGSVCGVDHERLACGRLFDDRIHHCQQFVPCLRLMVESSNLQLFRTTLYINEEWFRKLACEG